MHSPFLPDVINVIQRFIIIDILIIQLLIIIYILIIQLLIIIDLLIINLTPHFPERVLHLNIPE